MRQIVIWTLTLPLILFCSDSTARADASAKQGAHTTAIAMAKGGNMRLESSSFNDRGEIPVRHTCKGNDVSVPLNWKDAPSGTRSFALIIDDPDAPDPKHPKMVWVHWILYNMPPDVSALPEGCAELPAGTLEGLNDWKQTGYRGPCPPIGKHRYFHKLYALDTVLPNLKSPTKAKLLEAMEGHILATAELTGTFSK